ncbi:MAG: hypothetical protein H6Q30_2519 [Bacteroidetes bacterium]|nr:hypothetical protein [Bacteroidota bacterium]
MPEHFIRHIWQHQRFTATNLQTADGRPVLILSPGKANHDGGPDFKNARIRINHITYCGDVELHRDAASWRSHNHAIDPHYNKVILHVVMAADPSLPPACTVSRRAIPLLVLDPYLDHELRLAWEQLLHGPAPTSGVRLPCASVSGQFPHERMKPLLAYLARERLELKIRRFHERLQQLADERRGIVREPYPRYYGDPAQIPPPHPEFTRRDFANRDLWEQLFYEGIMECLGYAKNRKPFAALSRSMTLARLKRYPLEDTETMMALLFGAAGLLPSSRKLPEKESRVYVRGLRRRWKALHPLFRIPVLHEADWLFFRLRPGNFPTARLAAFCYLLPRLFGEDGFRRMIGFFNGVDCSTGERRKKLHEMFGFEADHFWQRHYHFRGLAGTWGASLGKDRVNEILVNAVIPITLLYARIFRNGTVQDSAKKLLSEIPPSPPNSLTLLLTRDLLHDRLPLRSAFLQQGAVQLYTLYCRKHRCNECEVGICLAPRTSLPPSPGNTCSFLPP